MTTCTAELALLAVPVVLALRDIIAAIRRRRFDQSPDFKRDELIAGELVGKSVRFYRVYRLKSETKCHISVFESDGGREVGVFANKILYFHWLARNLDGVPKMNLWTMDPDDNIPPLCLSYRGSVYQVQLEEWLVPFGGTVISSEFWTLKYEVAERAAAEGPPKFVIIQQKGGEP
jgi:hypothetical protein